MTMQGSDVQEMRCTIVFQKNWEAIHAVNADGSRKYRYIINTGASRSSKTASLIQCCDLYARNNYNKRVTVWRDTLSDCRKTILHDILGYFRQWPTANRGFNKTESVFSYPDTFSTFEIHGTDDEEKVMGMNKQVCWINEPYKISKDTFNSLDQRTDDFVIIDWNPKSNHWIDDLLKDPRTIEIKSTFRDNPFCPPEQRIKLLGYQPISLCEVVTSGLIIESEARKYDIVKNKAGFTDRQLRELQRCRDNEDKNSADAFAWAVYGLGIKGERPNRIFKFTEIPDERYKELDVPIYYGVDWGAVDPWGLLEIKYHDGALYWHELNYASENELRASMSGTDRAQIEGSEEGIVTWLFKQKGIDKRRPVICDNNRIEKVTALRRGGYQAILADKGSGSIIDGIDLINNLKNYYTRSSINLAREQEQYSREVDRYGVVLEDPEDCNNHLMDPGRYVARYLRKAGIIKKL